MFEYEDIIKNYAKGPFKENGSQLKCICPFHEDHNPSLDFNMEKGVYFCHVCGAKGNMTSFLAEVTGKDKKEVWKMLNPIQPYTLEEYANEKKIPINELKDLGLANSDNDVRIPYFDTDNKLIATRFRHNPDSKQRFTWEKGSKANLYGLWKLSDFTDEYIVLVEGESDTHTLWHYGVQAIGVPGATNFKTSFKDILKKFKKVYAHSEEDEAGKRFVNNIANVLYPQEVHKINCTALGAKDPSELHCKGAFDFEKLLNTAELIEVEDTEETETLQISGTPCIDKDTPLNEIAEYINSFRNIAFFKQQLYEYNNGVYTPDDGDLESFIYNARSDLKKSDRREVLDYLKIITRVKKVPRYDDYINFQNGIFDLKRKVMIPHDPKIFMINQVNANYIENAPRIEFVDKYLYDIASGNEARIKTILQIIGYCMTTSVKLQRAFILYGKTAENGKSVLVDVITELIGDDNTSHVSLHDMQGGKFYSSELTDKLLNVVAELPRNNLKSVEVFKSLVTGDKMAVEKKYKDRYTIKPYAKNIFTANELPRVDDTTEGFYRRLNILLFEAKFSDEAKKKFNKDNLLTKEARDYLASISVKAYLELLESESRDFANEEESNSVLDTYRKENNSVLSFLDSNSIKERLELGQSIDRPELYSEYKSWCYECCYKPKGRNNFYKELGETGLVEVKLHNGYPKVRRNNVSYLDNKNISNF